MCILSKIILSRTNKFVFTASAQVYPFENSGVPQYVTIRGAQFVKYLLNTQKKQLLSNLRGSTL